MLMLVDAANLYFRAFYAVPESITAPDGRPVNAIRGYLDMTAALIARRRPTRHIACLDLDWRPAFRVALVPSYKAHRIAKGGGEDVPDALAPQIPVLLEVLAAFGLAIAGAEGFEADDVIATIAARDDDEVEVVSGDRDLLAVATDRVRVLYTGGGIAKMAAMGPAEVEAKYGVPAPNYADFAVLRGDPSDGLPGVPGVGDKTAAALITRFGSLEGIEKALEAGDTSGFPAGSRLKLEKARDYLGSAEMVVRVVTDIPIPDIDARLPRTPRSPERLVELTDRWNLEGPVNRLLGAVKTTSD
jgi:5'-3' exonuclease